MNRRPLLLALTSTAALLAAGPKVDSYTFSGLGIRCIGPAVMGGRVSAMDGYIDKGRINLYVGAAGGGVWKSQNGGTSFKPVFDKYLQSIGAIKVDPSHTDTIWVGTGEAWTRNSVSVGDGIYKTTDGGQTWANMGLKDSEHIAQVAIDPRNSDVVYAASLGHLWSSGGDRGLYKTTDGGKTWTCILSTNADSGCASVVVDPKNPDVLFASMWQFRRKAWAFESGGPGSGVFKSMDGGKTWTKLNGDAKRGLPMGELGRCAFAIAPSDPKIVYCLVEAKDGALFRSQDGGETWVRGNSGADTIIRPFYFSALFVDPKNPDRLFKPGLSLSISEDGGKTFSVVGGGAHGDFHAAWIDPERPDHLYAGSDGGFYESQDRGTSWVFLQNLPIAQYYHVTLDNEQPYNTYGGLQDNSSWRGPSKTGGSIQNRHWKNLYGGDGFWVQPDPTDATFVYAEAQGGDAGRVNTKTGENRSIKPREGAGEPKYRWNWNTPIVLSPNDKGALYMACQFLFRSKDKGLSWERLSPDLTTNDPKKQQQEDSGGVTTDNSAAENHCTIVSVAESPKAEGLIWVGTDDGNLQLTRDDGKTWTNLTGRIPGLPKNTWVSWVEPSPFDAGTAFACFDGHSQGDMAPRVYKTMDYGKTWTALGTAGVEGFVHVIRQDPENASLLYLGTEFGLYVSLDGGSTWSPFKRENFPKVAVMDIAIQPREKDLVLATHGRGVWIIDDLTPLRALGADLLQHKSAFLPTRSSERSVLSDWGWTDGDAQYQGQGPRSGAEIAYYQQKRHIFGELKFEILNGKGEVIGTLPGDPRRGLQRLYWSMALPGPRVPSGASGAGISMGPRVLEGTYKVRMTDGKDVQNGQLTIVPDPLSSTSPADRKAGFDLSMQLFGMVEDMAYTTDRLIALRDQANGTAVQDPGLKQRLGDFAKALEILRAKYVPTKEGGGITGEEKHREHLVQLYWTVAGFDGRPAPESYSRRDALKKDIGETDAEVAAFIGKSLASLNEALKSAGAKPIEDLSHPDWDRKTRRQGGGIPSQASEPDKTGESQSLWMGPVRFF